MSPMERRMNSPMERRYLWLFALLAVIGLSADQISKYVIFANLYSETEAARSVVVIPNLFHLRASHMHFKIEGGHRVAFLIRDSGDHPLSFLRTISGECLPSVNRGALFGIGNADAEDGGWNAFFLVVSILAAAFIVFWVRRPMVAKDRILCLALGLILGGTLGNLYDRIVFSGVRDFLFFYWDSHVWPDFNIADCCLVVGASILLLHSFLAREPAVATADSEASGASAAPVEAV
jgi:lipoprotein signal peptidase